MPRSRRTANRAAALGAAFLRALGTRRPRSRPLRPARLLVLHELLLGDTLMLAPLLASLRSHYPGAQLLVTAKPAYAPLFSSSPYGAQVLPFSERGPGALRQLATAREPDIVFLPGDNRFAMLARALGARWIAGFAAGRPAWRNRLLDEALPLGTRPASLADMFATLAGQDRQLRYAPGDWPAPACAPYPRPRARYAVLHVGAGSALRLWLPERWRALAAALAEQGLEVVFSAGPGEQDLVAAIDPQARHRSYAGQLALAQLWHLLAGAERLVTLDTGVAHLAKLTNTRTVVLYGPGSALLFGRGEYWRDAPIAEVTIADFPCRDQNQVFRREIGWVRRCNRGPAQCERARCMEAVTIDMVMTAIA